MYGRCTYVVYLKVVPTQQQHKNLHKRERTEEEEATDPRHVLSCHPCIYARGPPGASDKTLAYVAGDMHVLSWPAGDRQDRSELVSVQACTMVTLPERGTYIRARTSEYQTIRACGKHQSARVLVRDPTSHALFFPLKVSLCKKTGHIF